MVKPLHKRVLSHLRDLGLQPGDPVPTESELAAALLVSRPALREALGALEAVGLLVARQGARRTLGTFNFGVIVEELTLGSVPDMGSLWQLLEVRRVLEGGFFHSAAALLDPDRVAHLRTLTDRMRRNAAQGRTFLEEDAAFHAAIYEPLHNTTLSGLLRGFWELFNHMSADTTTGTNLPATALSHARIVDALAVGDVTLAAHHLNTHFFDVRARLQRQRRAAGEVLASPTASSTERAAR